MHGQRNIKFIILCLFKWIIVPPEFHNNGLLDCCKSPTNTGRCIKTWTNFLAMSRILTHGLSV